MLVNYFKLKNISKRGRVIALSVVGGVFVFLSLLSIWQRNFVDSLINYVPDEAVFYAHLSRPKINNLPQFDGLLAKMAADYGLTDLAALNINREMAIVGLPAQAGLPILPTQAGQVGLSQEGRISYGLIIKTDRPSKAKKVLTSAGLAYKFLAYNKIVIADKDRLDDYQKNRGNLVKSTARKRFYPLSSITLYASPEFFRSNSDDLFLNFIFGLLKNDSGDLVLNLKVQRDGLKVLTGGLSSAVSSLDRFPAKTPKEKIDGDLVLVTTDLQSALDSWQVNLKNISASDYDIFAGGKWGIYLNTYLPGETGLSAQAGRILLSVKKNQNNSNWLVSDYDFYLSIEKAYPAKVEEILKVLMANRYPSSQNIYLSDGTKVTEFLPDIKRWNFLAKNGANYLYSPDNQFKLIYKSLANNNIIITNSEELLSQNWPQPDFNYLRFNSDLLSDDGIGQYLKLFDELGVNNKGLFLK
ncbi:MAG: hypothetical protein A3B89_02940 [Candidatus Buchananbacteria bacterium RIFCSPHIGHO2_02_FULL_40_13]|uniref:DUF3352 domain-containing protein n=1 Tax=Candidatus Buchananbacteria bacterium RIFCSPLOWO2_01_FULL_39_33 TaxID=1797543 RepID=A0A1G1YG52_9BACT|nr:MAG: hypothetical protein A3B89_02940 [Candidatus Buchananbacteria bacterium RIFCSPHIGHO2_02_FULL_40_13]OGY51269.1 MAG: hypothetical protein A3A02_01510 [Candidatus Buchananbacteria bacterium RIFCSPLOWO2_01_FULL_39_33]